MKLAFLVLILCSVTWADWSANKALTLKKIRTYCKACHGVDDLRFIKNENDEDLWNTIFNERSPKSGDLWVNKIIETLNWPSNQPPGFDNPMNGVSNDWMPKGYKRILLSEDYEMNESTRLIILDTLKAGP